MKANRYEVRHNPAEPVFVWEVVEIATGKAVHASRDEDKHIAERIAWLRNA